MTNWFGARSLEMERQDGALAGPVNAYQKQPFFHVASNVLQPETGWLRSFLGTGDRQHLRTTPGTDCSADDLLACIRLKCDVKATFTAEVNGHKRTSTVEYVAGVLKSNTENWLDDRRLGVLGLAHGFDGAQARLPRRGAWAAPSSRPPPRAPPSACTRPPRGARARPGRGRVEGITLNTSEHHDQLLSATEQTEVAGNRYFGFHSYGGNKRVFQDEDGAVVFDGLRVTDKPSVTCAGMSCSLVDVTIPDTAYSTIPVGSGETQRYVSTRATLAKLQYAKAEDPGWFIRYNNSPMERTASGSTVLAGVVFWSSFRPRSGTGGAVCSLSGLGDASYSWQADVISGQPDQASSFQVFDSAGKPCWLRRAARPARRARLPESPRPSSRCRSRAACATRWPCPVRARPPPRRRWPARPTSPRTSPGPRCRATSTSAAT